MRVLFIGDIVGSPGRQIVRDRLADLVEHQHIDLVIANGENSAAGFGITPRIAEELLQHGIDVLTGGNHSWDRKEIFEFMPHEPRLLRPANFPEAQSRRGRVRGHRQERREICRFKRAGPGFPGSQRRSFQENRH